MSRLDHHAAAALYAGRLLELGLYAVPVDRFQVDQVVRVAPPHRDAGRTGRVVEVAHDGEVCPIRVALLRRGGPQAGTVARGLWISPEFLIRPDPRRRRISLRAGA